MALKSSGITTDTPKKIMFGAGTIHKGFEYSEGTGWNDEESIIGATSGGMTLTITPEFVDLDIDGKLVVVKDLYVKTGETATMEVNFAELTEEIIKMMVVGNSEESIEVTGNSEVTTKARVGTNDYIENLAYCGKTLQGEDIIIIFKNALCTSGMSLSGQNKSMGTFSATFTCAADLDGDHEVLPIRIIYPTQSA